MRVPLSWLRDYVEIELSPEELARQMTFAGLEVEAMEYVGLPLPADRVGMHAKISGLEWDREKIKEDPKTLVPLPFQPQGENDDKYK